MQRWTQEEGGWENDNEQSLLRFLKIKDVHHRRELFQPEALRSQLFLAK